MQKSMASRKEMTGIEDNPIFWASGISLVAHMNSPKVPAVHMNTRMFWTPVASWFGGGTDLNPMIEVAEETKFFHKVLKKKPVINITPNIIQNIRNGLTNTF